MRAARKSSPALAVLVLAACASQSGGASHGVSGSAANYPPGIAPFANNVVAARAGLYTNPGRNCCFVGPRAHLILKKPAGALIVRFSFYVPNVPPYATGESVTVSAAGRRATGANVSGKWITVTLHLPERYRNETGVPVTIIASKSMTPQKLGLNSDTRNLSVVLVSVDYS